MKNCKLILLVFLLTLVPLVACAKNDPLKLATVERENVAQIEAILEKGINIERSTGDRIKVWVADEEFDWLLEQGWEAVWVPEENYRIPWEPRPKGPKTITTPLNFYPTHEEIGLDLAELETNFPNLCRVESIGTSVQGRELWFIKISDNPDVEEDEPEFKYISTMHGNETTGMPMLMNLIHLLLEDYGTDPRITSLVDETEIWIMPLMNPDGYSRPFPVRHNANNRDLNRDFPDRNFNPVNTPAGRQPETQAIMAFGAAHSSVMSANFHGGALVMNYPWDSATGVQCETSPPGPVQPSWITPDDEVFVANSLAYSTPNIPMFNGSFSQGISNGIDWYSICGGMQDWNYQWLGCMEITIEISNTKNPSPTTLLGFWGDNEESILAYMEQVHIGVRGVITDANTSDPLAATIRVAGRDQDNFTDPDVGDYHRLLLPGTYDLAFEADGYVGQIMAGVVVTASAATRLDVQLQPIPTPTSTITLTATSSPTSTATPTITETPTPTRPSSIIRVR